MNLYKFHSKPEQLDHYSDALYSYRYALDILKKPWPSGEAAIASDAEYSFLYAEEFNLKLVDGEFVPK